MTETDVQGLDALVRHSEDIIVGKVASKQTFISDDERSIWSRYQVVVEESFKGALSRLEVVHLQIPGGRVEFSDGTWAEFKLAKRRGVRAGPELFQEPVRDERFVVFARRLSAFVGPAPPPSEPVLQWTAGAQSLLEIRAVGTVTSRGPRSSFTETMEGLSLDELRRRVKSLK